MSITLKNKSLVPFITWLSKLDLSGRESRIRTRFIKSVRDRMLEIETTRLEIVQKYARKDEQGEYIKNKGNYTFETDSFKRFKDEFDEILLEDYVIDIMDSNKETLKSISDILIHTEVKISGEDADWYDEVCEEFESKLS